MPAPRLRRLLLAVCLASAALIEGAAPAWPLASGLDPTFDDDGVVVTPVGEHSSGRDVLVQPDGRIVVVGSSSTGFSTPGQPTLVRYLPGGETDVSFDGDGIAVPAMTGLAGADLHAVALGPDGTLVAGGVACVGVGDGYECGRTLVARFTSAGALDTTFGQGDGSVTVSHLGSGAARDVAVRSDGGVIAIAGIHALAFESDGDPDPAFGGGDGVAELAPNILTHDLVLDAQGRAVVVGSTANPLDLWVARLETDGDLDTTFSPGGTDGSGILRMDLSSVVGRQYAGDVATAVAIDDSGRVVVGGVTERASDGRIQPYVMRLTSAGVPDTSFSGDGLTFNDLPDRPGGVVALAIQPDGAIVFVGGAKELVEGTDEVMVGRFLPNGAPDTSFGGTGIVTFPLDAALVTGGGMVLQDDGAIVMAAELVHEGLGQAHIGAIRFVGVDPCTQIGTPGADTLTGTAGPDVLCGLGGNDVLIGKAGDDVLIGGSGLDTASYVGAGTAITASLGTGVATGLGTDTLEEMERITGGLKGDTITGDGAANTLTGGPGADTLNGGRGADSLLGGDGSDVLNGGASNDTLNGGPGTDDCNQGAGSGPKTSCET